MLRNWKGRKETKGTRRKGSRKIMMPSVVRTTLTTQLYRLSMGVFFCGNSIRDCCDICVYITGRFTTSATKITSILYTHIYCILTLLRCIVNRACASLWLLSVLRLCCHVTRLRWFGVFIFVVLRVFFNSVVGFTAVVCC